MTPKKNDIFTYGCESNILQLLKLPDGTVKVLAEGIDRVKILECKDDKEYMTTLVKVVKDKIESQEDSTAFSIAIVRKLEKLTNLNKKSEIFEYLFLRSFLIRIGSFTLFDIKYEQADSSS